MLNGNSVNLLLHNNTLIDIEVFIARQGFTQTKSEYKDTDVWRIFTQIDIRQSVLGWILSTELSVGIYERGEFVALSYALDFEQRHTPFFLVHPCDVVKYLIHCLQRIS